MRNVELYLQQQQQSAKLLQFQLCCQILKAGLRLRKIITGLLTVGDYHSVISFKQKTMQRVGHGEPDSLLHAGIG